MTQTAAPDPAHDPAVKSPAHYRGKSGLQSIEVTHAYRLGPDLTQAVDYLLRAGRKTPDPRQDLAKAVFYLRYAAGLPRDRVFAIPEGPRPTPAEVAHDFALDLGRSQALGLILRPLPSANDCEQAACLLDLEIERETLARLPSVNTGRAA